MSTTPGTVTDLRGFFRRCVAEDTADIRTLKARVRSEQGAQSDESRSLQSKLARLRRAARARHLTYSLWKGRTWAEIENNRPDGDPLFSHAIALAWKEAAVATGETGPPPENLKMRIARWL